jgi:hypothetical protein
MADVPVVNPRGELVNIDEADLQAALSSRAGYRLPSEAESKIAAGQDKAAALEARDAALEGNLVEKGYNPLVAKGLAAITPSSSWVAGNQALWEGATGGLMQAGVAQGLRAIKPEWADAYTKDLKDLREAYPERREVGNVVGNIARDAVLGATGIGTIAGGIESGVGRGLASMGFEGSSVLGRAGAAALRYGAGAGVENALISASQELSEEMLGPNVELNAEKILAAAGEGGLLGLAFGGGLGAAGSLARSGVKGAARMAVDTLDRNASKLEEYANEQRWRAISPGKKFSEEAQQRIPGGINKVGEVMREYGLTGKTWQEAFEGGDPASILEKTEAARDMVGHQLGEIHATSPASIKAGELLDEIERHIEPIRTKGGFDDMVTGLERYKESLFDKILKNAPPVEAGPGPLTPDAAMRQFRDAPIPVQDAIYQRKALDELIYRGSNPLNLSPIKKELEGIRGGFEDLIVKGIDSAAKNAGDAETGAKLLKLKGDYQALSLIEKAGEKSNAGYVTNRNISLSGQLAGAAMMASGHGLLAIPTAIGHQVIKTRGNALAAHALDQMAELGMAFRLARKADQSLGSAAKGLVGDGGKTKALAGPYRTLARRYADAVEHTAQLRADQGLAERVTSRPIQNAPNTSAAVAAKAAQSVAYLVSRIPPTLDRPSLGAPERRPRQTEAEMQRFVTTYEAVRNPQSVLDNLSAGRVKRVEIYALRDTSPEMFADLQKRTLEEVARKQASGTPLTHDQRLKLGIVLDIPTDPSLEPATLSRLQASLQQSTKEGQNQTAPRSPQGTDSQLAANGIDRLEAM